MNSFTRKALTAVITLEGQTFEGGGNTVTLKGLRIVADIDKVGGLSFGTARIRIYGMRQKDMNQLTQLAFHPLEIKNNTIQILAAAGDSQPSKVYEGTILKAWANYQEAPDVPLYIEAQTGYFPLINPAQPNSFKAPLNVADAMKNLASQMGFSFQNNGVNAIMSYSYFPGTAMDQARALANAAGIDMYLDDDVLAITPKGLARETSDIPLISKDTGLVGYPSFDIMGISLRCLFNPAIVFGGLIKIESEVTTANGTWRVAAIGHALESEKPDGQWFSNLFVTNNELVIKR